MDMHVTCPGCGQEFELRVGFTISVKLPEHWVRPGTHIMVRKEGLIYEATISPKCEWSEALVEVPRGQRPKSSID